MNKETQNLIWDVRAWWNERIIAGSQVEDWSKYLEVFDWSMGDRKNDPSSWKKWVRCDVLHAEYEAYSNSLVTKAKWRYVFPRAARTGTAHTRFIRLSNGKRRLVSFYKFEKQPLTVLPL